MVLTVPVFELPDGNEPPRLAHISLQDQRMGHLHPPQHCSSLQVSACRTGIQVGSPREALWITEPSVHGLEEIQQFVRERPGRRVIVVGSPPESWNEPGIIMVDRSHRALRAAIQNTLIECLKQQEYRS